MIVGSRIIGQHEILGMLRRVVISLFMHCRARRPEPQYQSLADFQSAMGENNLAKASCRF